MTMTNPSVSIALEQVSVRDMNLPLREVSAPTTTEALTLTSRRPLAHLLEPHGMDHQYHGRNSPPESARF